MSEWRVLTSLSDQPSTALRALVSWPQPPSPPARHWARARALPAPGSQAGLRLCRGGKQCVVFLLEGKVLQSPHGQGCRQALPGESRGEDSGEGPGKAEAPAGEGASVGTRRSGFWTCPPEVLTSDHFSSSSVDSTPMPGSPCRTGWVLWFPQAGHLLWSEIPWGHLTLPAQP